MKALLVAALFLLLTLLRAETVVIERDIPTLPSPPNAVIAPLLKAEWSQRTTAEISALLASAIKEKQDVSVISARDWLATHRRKDGDIWMAALANAKAGRNDAAFYWLSQAARYEECEVEEIESSESCRPLLRDPRWEGWKKHFIACAEAWQKSTYSRTILTLPTTHTKGAELPLVIGLHGYGSAPEDFRGDDIQKIADEMNVAFLSVSGRGVLWKNSFEWTSDGVADVAHIFRCIDGLDPYVKEKKSAMVVIGFSQGGQMSLQLLTSHPVRIRGALAMSPGSRHASKMRMAISGEKSAVLSQNKVFFSWISGEGAAMSSRCHSDAEWLRSHGASVELKEFPGKGHSWPNGYAEHFTHMLRGMK